MMARSVQRILPLICVNPIVGCHRCKEGWIQLAGRVTDTPDRALLALGFTEQEIQQLFVWILSDEEEERQHYIQAVANKFRTWKALELEAHFAKTNACCAIVPRTYEEFLSSEHGQLSSKWPPVFVIPQKSSIPGAWEPVEWSTLSNPKKQGLLHGIKIVEMSRMVMAPVAGYNLHTFGANIVKVCLPTLDEGYWGWSQNQGKRNVYLGKSCLGIITAF